MSAASGSGVVLIWRTLTSSQRPSRNSKVSAGPSRRPRSSAFATSSRARSERLVRSSGALRPAGGRLINRPEAAIASPVSSRLPSASNCGHSQSRPVAFLSLLLSRSHTSISVRENCGLTSVPPMRCGKDSCRRRQLLTAARPTPASRAISAKVTGTARDDVIRSPRRYG